jgi:hypothetical protein
VENINRKIVVQAGQGINEETLFEKYVKEKGQGPWLKW